MRLTPHPFTPSGDDPSKCGALADDLMCLLPANAYEHQLGAAVDDAITTPTGSVDVEHLPAWALCALLRNGAQEEGTAAAEASVELLIRHGSWLIGSDHADFRRSFVSFGLMEADVHPARECAHVQWRGALLAIDAGQIAPGSRSAEQMLRIAASFGAGDAAGVWVNLAAAIAPLDYQNAGLVAAAMMHAAGWPQHWPAPPHPSATALGQHLAELDQDGALTHVQHDLLARVVAALSDADRNEHGNYVLTVGPTLARHLLDAIQPVEGHSAAAGDVEDQDHAAGDVEDQAAECICLHPADADCQGCGPACPHLPVSIALDSSNDGPPYYGQFAAADYEP